MQLGELVLVRHHPGKVLMAALMMPVLPLVCFFTGYWLGGLLWSAGKIAGCMAMALGIVIGSVYNRRIASKRGSGYTLMKYPQNINKGDNRFD